MRKFAFVLSALVAALFISGTAHAQSLSSSVHVSNRGVSAGFSAYSNQHRNHGGGNWNNGGGRWNGGGRGRGTSVDIHIGNGRWGGSIHTGPTWRGPVYRNYPPVYRNYPRNYPRVFVPAPIYRDPCGYDYRGCGSSVSSSITVRVQETFVDQYGRVGYTGRTLLYTAYYDGSYGAYVYTNQYGQLVIVR